MALFTSFFSLGPVLVGMLVLAVVGSVVRIQVYTYKRMHVDLSRDTCESLGSSPSPARRNGTGGGGVFERG